MSLCLVTLYPGPVVFGPTSVILSPKPILVLVCGAS